MEMSFLRRLTACLFTLSLVPTTFARAPREQAEQPQPVVRVTTRLVHVNVIVQDKKGEPVSGLTRDDFKVLDGSKEQKISVFSLESSRSLPAPPQPLPPNVFSNRWEIRGDVPTSVTVILLDGLNTRFEDQASARDQIIKFLSQLQPQDRVSLYALGSNLRVVHDFTNDAAPLLRAIRHYRSRVPSELAASEPDESGQAGTSDASDPETAQFDAFMQDAAQRMADFYTINRADQTLRAIEAIANHFSKLPGRKNLIWVSGSFPMWIGYDSLSPTAEKRNFSPEIGRTVQALNDADLAIYPVDARGLVPDPGFSAARKGSSSGDSFSKIQLTMDTMQDLAERTGGLAFYNSNDIKGAIRSAIDDSRLTYVLGYYPAGVPWNGKFREIKVMVKRSGLRLRYRRGYFAVPEETLDDEQRITD
jgi:VWFA-related protein